MDVMFGTWRLPQRSLSKRARAVFALHFGSELHRTFSPDPHPRTPCEGNSSEGRHVCAVKCRDESSVGSTTIYTSSFEDFAEAAA
jgi:hypothetical protein